MIEGVQSHLEAGIVHAAHLSACFAADIGPGSSTPYSRVFSP